MITGLGKILILVFVLSINLVACAKVNHHGHDKESEEVVLAEKDSIAPDKVDLEMIYDENRGLRVVRENALTFHDYYRGAVQRKEEAEILFEKGEYSKAENLFQESNKWLAIVLKLKGDDEINLPIYHSTAIRYMPNFLIGDNIYKLAVMSEKQGLPLEAVAYYQTALDYLNKSLSNNACAITNKRLKEVESRLEYIKYDIFVIFSMSKPEKSLFIA